MEHINSIIRTLCLVALLCLTSGNAFAYKVYDNGDINANLWNMENDKILVVTKDATVGNCYVAEGYALVILPGVTVEVTSNFNNQGTIYVFGKLYCVVGHIYNNGGTINMIYPGKVEGEFMGSGTKNDNFNPFQVVPAKAPTSTENGWKEYWEAKSVCGNDSYIEGNYEQNNFNTKISNLDAWKAGDGKLKYNTPTKIAGQQPTAEHDFVGWKDYYQQVCTTSTGENYTFYAEDEAFTKQITDLEAWKTTDAMVWGAEIGEKCYILEKQNGEFVYDGNLTFTDKEAYRTKFDLTVNGSITYSRTFKATGVWQAWFVPFDVTVSDMNAAGMEVAKIAGVLMDGEVPYIAFAKMTAPYAIVNANTPYVVKAKESSVSMTLTGPDMCIRKSTDAELKAQRLTVQSSFDTFTFGGNYQQTKGYANEWYALNTSGIFQMMGEGVDLAPQRFWMTIDTRTDTPYYTGGGADAKEFINMTVFGDDDPTGITSYENESESKGVIYNIHGQKVTRIQSGQVYIMNGKKYLAR